MPSRGGILGLRATGGKGTLELLVKIDAVGDQHDAGIYDFAVER
jgi:hypothetical protein